MGESAAEVKRMDQLVRAVNQKPNDPALRYDMLADRNESAIQNGRDKLPRVMRR